MSTRHTSCLVTGGASFIGSHLAEALVRSGAKVRVADDLSSGVRRHLSGIEKEIEFLEGDLRNIEFTRKAVQGCEHVFHLAADHGGRGYIHTHPANCAVNMALDNLVFHCAAQSGVRRITFASSACVYPTDLQQEDPLLLKEDMVCFRKRGGAFADETYGWAKLMGELSLQAHHLQFGISAASVRISTAYGPRENESHAIIALIAKAFVGQNPFEIWGDGEQTRGFTYVDDVVAGLMLAGEHITDGGAVNIGGSAFISLNQVAGMIFRELGWEPPDGIRHLADQPVGVKHRALDGSYALSRLGWKPEVPLEEGLRRTIRWYCQTHDRKQVAQTLKQQLNSRK
ncbi:MAG: NAD-dependent epimerase/dehydratase family protein [Kiritimatiellia bacterium]